MNTEASVPEAAKTVVRLMGMLGLSMVLSACVLLQSQREIAELQQKLPEQKAELARLQSENAELDREKANLLKEVERSELAPNELATRLKALDREIANERRSSLASHKRLANAQARIQGFERELHALQQDSGALQEDKQRQISELKEQIRTYLNLGLNSERDRNSPSIPSTPKRP